MQVREKAEKSHHIVFFQYDGSRRLKSRLVKAAGGEPAGQMRDEKLLIAVARSTFGSQKCEKLTASVDVSKFRCGKSARRSGANQISRS